MRPRYLGDSYDIVKQSLLRWLGTCGPWMAHPMFTERVSPEEAAAFSRLLGVPLISTEMLDTETNREAYFAVARSCADHLFLDPDTGLRLRISGTKNRASYLLGPELVSIVCERPMSLTLIFDQSLARGSEREQLAEKLAHLSERGLASFAYVSHACFILTGTSEELVKTASEIIQRESGLPTNRFVVSMKPHNNSLHRMADKAASR